MLHGRFCQRTSCVPHLACVADVSAAPDRGIGIEDFFHAARRSAYAVKKRGTG